MSEADTRIDTMITDKSLGAVSKIPFKKPAGASSHFETEKARKFVEKSR